MVTTSWPIMIQGERYLVDNWHEHPAIFRVIDETYMTHVVFKVDGLMIASCITRGIVVILATDKTPECESPWPLRVDGHTYFVKESPQGYPAVYEMDSRGGGVVNIEVPTIIVGVSTFAASLGRDSILIVTHRAR